jgi:hypothetical protein
MTTFKQARYGRFQRGSAVFQCRNCQRSTRDTGDNGSVELCPECYELAGLENQYNDNGYHLDDADRQAAVTYLGQLAAHIGERAYTLHPELSEEARKWVVPTTPVENVRCLPHDTLPKLEEPLLEELAETRPYCVALVTTEGEYMVAVCARRAKAAKREAARECPGKVVEAHAFLM